MLRGELADPRLNQESSGCMSFGHLTTEALGAAGKSRGFVEPARVEKIQDPANSILCYFIGNRLEQDGSFPVLVCRAQGEEKAWYTAFISAEDAATEEDIIRQAAQTATQLNNPAEEITDFLNLCQPFDAGKFSEAVVRAFSIKGLDNYSKCDAWGMEFSEQDPPADSAVNS